MVKTIIDKMNTTIERVHVLDVYERIANSFDDTRYSVWNFVKEFLRTKEHLFGIDIGCGNGKNMIHVNMIGVDVCKNLLKSAKRNNPNNTLCLSNCMDLPFRDNIFDYAIGISVYHHLSTEERRTDAVCEMIRVMKHGADGLINFWSHENQTRRKLDIGDNYVSWKSEHNARYYYIYNEKTLMSFMNNVIRLTNILVTNIFNEQGNWVVIFVKPP
jgi:ubiquinone/menaquinone biosynthesis C-methylase UbiE